MLFGGAFYWLRGDLEKRADAAQKDRAIIESRSRILESLARLKTDSGEAAIYKKAIDLILPVQDKLLEFPRWLDAAARLRQVGQTFNFRGSAVPPGENTPGYIVFTLDMSGQLDNLSNLLKDIESGKEKFLARFDNFDLTRTESGYRLLTQGRVFFGKTK